MTIKFLVVEEEEESGVCDDMAGLFCNEDSYGERDDRYDVPVLLEKIRAGIVALFTQYCVHLGACLYLLAKIGNIKKPSFGKGIAKEYFFVLADKQTIGNLDIGGGA